MEVYGSSKYLKSLRNPFRVRNIYSIRIFLSYFSHTIYFFCVELLMFFVWNRVLGLIILGQIYTGNLFWFQAMLKLNEICSVWVFWLREIPVEFFFLRCSLVRWKIILFLYWKTRVVDSIDFLLFLYIQDEIMSWYWLESFDFEGLLFLPFPISKI